MTTTIIRPLLTSPQNISNSDSLVDRGQKISRNKIGHSINCKVNIIQMSLVFACLSASLHQIWFFYNGKSEAFTQSLFVMAVGNLLGTALVLVAISILTSKLKNKKVL